MVPSFIYLFIYFLLLLLLFFVGFDSSAPLNGYAALDLAENGTLMVPYSSLLHMMFDFHVFQHDACYCVTFEVILNG